MLTKRVRFDLFIDELYEFSFRNRKGQYGVHSLAFLIGLTYAVIFGVIRGRTDERVAYESLILSLVVLLRLYLGKGIRSSVLRLVQTPWRVLRWFFKDRLERFLLAIGLATAIYAAYRLREDFTTGGLFLLDAFGRSLSWLLGSTAVQSILGPVALVVIYGAWYRWRLRMQRFIVVSEFRVWGKLEKASPAKGVAGRLQDELMRLLAEMRAPEFGLPLERARPGAVSNAQADSSKDKPELSGGFVPETQVTLQYEGISLEGLHTFVRRNTGREVVITGDLLGHPDGFLLVARTKDDGPWEVLVKSLDAASLGEGLQKLAVRILTTLAQGFLPKEANNFVFLQFKADDLKEHDLVVRLAHLALESAPNKYESTAQENLAKAYYKRGLWLTESRNHNEAILDFKEATDWFPNYSNAWNSLGEAYQAIGDEEKAKEAFQEANDTREEGSGGDPDIS